MPNDNKPLAVVKGAIFVKKSPDECIAIGDKLVAAGGASAAVQGSPVAVQALGGVKAATDKLRASRKTRLTLDDQRRTAIKAEKDDRKALRTATDTYGSAVNDIAKGNATIINDAGLADRNQKKPKVPLANPAHLTSKPGKNEKEALVSWPEGPGASAYAMQANYNPSAADGGTWVDLPSGSVRRRPVKGPTPGCQFQVRIASIGGDVQLPWTAPILATAR